MISPVAISYRKVNARVLGSTNSQDHVGTSPQHCHMWESNSLK